jgi:ser/thr/tyr protein kinase RAD53
LGPPLGAAEKEDYRWLYHHIGVRKQEAVTGIWAKYDLGAELGRGTFASVFRCMDKNTGKWYAVKIIQRSKFLNSPINEINFGREIEILTWMSHVSVWNKSKTYSHCRRLQPNIVQLIEVFEEPETFALVMEEVPGGELLMRITARDGLRKFYESLGLHSTNRYSAEAEARFVTYQICHAMSYIHEQGITHR